MMSTSTVLRSADLFCAAFLFGSLVLWVSDVEAITEGVATTVAIVMWAVAALVRGR